MNCTKMKKLFRKGTLSILLLGVITFFTYPLSAQTNSRSGKGLYEIFSTKIPDGAQWKAQDNKFVRDGGYSKKSENYIYVGASKSPAELTGHLFVIRAGAIHHFETVESVQEGGFTVNAVERSPVGKLFVCKIFKDLVQVVPLRTVGTAGCKDNRVRFR